jgi:hypothetical protein
MHWPAVKMTDMVMGVDFHTVLIVVPVPMTPHPYFGVIFLWMTPSFPKVNTLINKMPACTAGSMGYSVHIPFGAPIPPTMMNLGYWRRHLMNVPKALMLVALTLLANMAIAGISKLFIKPDSATGKFMKDVTGVDPSDSSWTTIKSAFSAYTQWSTWVKLLMPPVPFPGGQGSSAIGSPNVTVNGGALGFVAPLMGASCSDLPIVPNAMPIAFSNVLVGVSIGDMVRAIAVSAAQGAVGAAVSAGVSRAGKKSCGCGG